MKIAIYSRVSSADQDNENQLAQLRDFAAKQGWHLVGEFVDVASGKSGDREQFKALFEAASRREFDLVLFWSLDRFSREGVFETLQYLQRLTAFGVGYRSFTEQYLDSCGIFREAVISILAVIAKQERVRLSERTKAGLAKAKAQGRLAGRPRALTGIQCKQAAELRAQGASWPAIGCRMGVHPDTARYSVAIYMPTISQIQAGKSVPMGIYEWRKCQCNETDSFLSRGQTRPGANPK